MPSTKITTNEDTPSASSLRFPLPLHESPTGISVLIVGAGVAGLLLAVECWRYGIDVQIIERAPSRMTGGDGVSIGHTVIQSFRNWPYMAKTNEEIAFDPWVAYCNSKGEQLAPHRNMNHTPSADVATDGVPPPMIYRHSRPKLHLMLETQLEQTGLRVQYRKRAVRYFEELEGKKAGIELENGEILVADIVVAADGIGSHSTKNTLGYEVPARSTGRSIYRAAYPLEIAFTDPAVKERYKLLPNGHMPAEMWVGDGIRATFSRNQDEIAWTLNHMASQEASESWSKSCSPEEVFKTIPAIEKWPEFAKKIVRLTPKEKLVDFGLVWRDPQPAWTSASGRIVQIGDAAHTFLPSSGNGATQGMEDAISLAKCLRIAGKENAPEATKVHNKLRYERVSCLQLLGICNQASDDGRNPDKYKAAHPKYIRALMASWIWNHDPEKYATEKYDEALAALSNGVPFQNTNIPAGYVYKPWNFESLLKEIEEKGEIELDGDWEI